LPHPIPLNSTHKRQLNKKNGVQVHQSQQIYLFIPNKFLAKRVNYHQLDKKYYRWIGEMLQEKKKKVE
jgi:hypothetical protein